ERVLSFVRQGEANKVFAVLNFSGEMRRVRFRDSLADGTYTEHFSGAATTIDGGAELELPPWGYRVFVR
ncbi:MAG: alpha amylase C-terminal domain-containing protein, partial [Nitrospira sp.]|nr:alpha amylase C-terminal domain-containing protein [Nitrospira sp.]